MRDEIKEARRLKHLLQTLRLSEPERLALEAQLRELEKPRTDVPTNGLSEGVFGVFDRPKTATPEPSSPPPEIASAPSAKTSQPESRHRPTQELVPERELFPAEAEALAARIAEIANRITWLRRYWATCLNREIDAESEMWLARLQQLSKELPQELLEATLGPRIYLVTQQVRDVRRPLIAEKMQLQVFPPSAPSLDSVGTLSEIYYAVHEQGGPSRPAEHPPGYVPDGLQQFL